MSWSEIYGIGLVSGAFGLLFVLGEYLRRKRRMDPEFSRKLVHFGGCMVALSFPCFFASSWPVLVLAVGFVTLIFCGARFHFLHSIHDVDRESLGGIYHPIAIYVCFVIASLLGQWVVYEIAIMVLALSDSMAALVGKIYGRSKYEVDAGSSKSIEGSAIFFLLTFLIVEISLLLATGIGRLECILLALLIAILVTLFEAISLDGSDNLFVPLGTVFILSKNIDPAPGELTYQLGVLVLSFALLHLLIRPYRKIALSGYIAIALAAYTAWGLVDVYWMLPILYGVALICRSDWFVVEPERPEYKHRMLRAFYLVLVPVLWLLAANLTGKVYGVEVQRWFFPSYASALTAQLMISRIRLKFQQRRHYPAGRLFLDNLWCTFPVMLAALPVFGVKLMIPWGILAGVAVLTSFAGCRLYRRILLLPKDYPQSYLLKLRMSLVLGVSCLPLLVAAVYVWNYNRIEVPQKYAKETTNAGAVADTIGGQYRDGSIPAIAE